jgi:DNA-binding MarR family transcriptional regulator
MTRTKEVERTAEGAALSELILSIFRANVRLIRAGDVLTRDLGLTSARWQVLGAIAPAPKTVAQVAREFELTRQGVLWVVQSMIRDGFVELIDNPDHRRAKLVRHTQDGKAIYDRISRRQKLWANRLGQSFDRVALEATVKTVRQLSEAIIGITETFDEK